MRSSKKRIKKDLEEIKSHNTIVLETLDHDGDLILENEKLKEENKNSRKRKIMMHSRKRTRSSSWRKNISRLD